MTWTFPGGLSGSQEPCAVDGGYDDGSGFGTSAFVTVTDAYNIKSLGTSITVQVMLPGSGAYDDPKINASGVVLVIMGTTSTVSCMLEKGFVRGYDATSSPVGSLGIDVKQATYDARHGTITAAVDCVNIQTKVYLGAVGTIHIVY